jgi:MFS family permease
VVVGSGIAQAVGPSVVIFGTLSVFLLPIAADTGWSRTSISLAFTLMTLGMGIGYPIVGRLVDVFSTRPIVVISWFGFSVATSFLAFVPADPFLFVVPFFFAGVFSPGASLTFTRAIVSWFDNRRALAIGISSGIMGLGTTFAPLISNGILSQIGWRAAYPVLAAASFIIGMVMLFALVRVRGERSVRGRLVDHTKSATSTVVPDLPGMELRAAVASRQFWMIALSLTAIGASISALGVHLVGIATDRGLSAADGVGLVAIFGIASLLGRVIGGFLFDRIRVTIVAPIIILLPVLGLLLLGGSFTQSVLAVVLIGVAWGAETDLLPFAVTRYFGMRAFGRVLGVLLTVFVVGNSVGPAALGIIYDSSGSYALATPIITVAMILAAVSFALLGEYRYPAIKGFDKLAAIDEEAAEELLKLDDIEVDSSVEPASLLSGGEAARRE